MEKYPDKDNKEKLPLLPRQSNLEDQSLAIPLPSISLEKYKTKFLKASPVLSSKPRICLDPEVEGELDISPIGNYKTKELVSQRMSSLNPTRHAQGDSEKAIGEEGGDRSAMEESKNEDFFIRKHDNSSNKGRKLIRKKVKVTSRDLKSKTKAPTKNSLDRI